ncbi:hypothetical protein [Amycolatopsis sp. WGS_07]|uniref:hypothetical protein n=1 Tax=Amycolatopsis sp. WGS_07 TaxID=3076764 RepID=UPI0038734F73
MHAWTMTIGNLEQTGEAETPAEAWSAVHAAAAAAVRDEHVDTVRLAVGDQQATVRPSRTGYRSADAVALLDLIRSGEAVVVEAHRNPPTEDAD